MCLRCGSHRITTSTREDFGDRYLIEHCDECSYEDEYYCGTIDEEESTDEDR